MVAFNIECTIFEVGEGVPERRFNAPLTALTGETGSGKSTVLEAVWWTLGVDGMKLMRAAAACARVGFAARIGASRWRITRSTTHPKDDVAFTNVTTGVEEQHPVKGSESRRSAADVFQDLLGIPRLGTGRTRVTLDLLQPWIYARQASLPTYYLGGQGKEQRVAVRRVLLGADDETVDALRQDSTDKSKKVAIGDEPGEEDPSGPRGA